MEDWRGVKPNVTAIGQAGRGAAPAHYLADFVFLDAAEAMTSRRNLQRSIVSRNRVKVHSNCDHGLQDRHWWSDVLQTLLDGPRPEVVHEVTLLHDDRAILMPSQRPVQSMRFVEQERTDGKATGAEFAYRHLTYWPLR